MQRFSFFFGFILSAIVLSAQSRLIWQKTMGTAGEDFAYSVCPSADGGCVVAGLSLIDEDKSIYQYNIFELDNSGRLVWQKRPKQVPFADLIGITNANDGGFYVCGSANYNGNDDFYLMKLNASGEKQWSENLGGTTGDDKPFSVCGTSDGGVVVVGYTMSNDGDVGGNHGLQDAWVVKLTADGFIKWQICIGGSENDVATSVCETPEGDYIIAGYSASSDGDFVQNKGFTDIFIVKLNNKGKILWRKTYGGSGWEEAMSVKPLIDGGYVVAGYTNSYNGDVTAFSGGTSDAWILKLDENGNIIWQKSLGDIGDDVIYSVLNTDDGNFIFTGETHLNKKVSSYHNETDLWIFETDGDGNLLWQKCFGGSSYDTGRDIAVLSDGGYIVVGATFSEDGDLKGKRKNWDFWILKFEF